MAARKRRYRATVPTLMTELLLFSAENIGRRMSMMSRGVCTPAEYRRMAAEKAEAAVASAFALMRPGKDPAAAVLRPWHRRAKANAERLRRK